MATDTSHTHGCYTHTHKRTQEHTPSRQPANLETADTSVARGSVGVWRGDPVTFPAQMHTHTHPLPWQRVLHCSVSFLADVAVGSDTNKFLSCHSWVLVGGREGGWEPSRSRFRHLLRHRETEECVHSTGGGIIEILVNTSSSYWSSWRSNR